MYICIFNLSYTISYCTSSAYQMYAFGRERHLYYVVYNYSPQGPKSIIPTKGNNALHLKVKSMI